MCFDAVQLWERRCTMETNTPFLCIHEGGNSEWKYCKIKKLQCIMGRAVAEEEFMAGEMCV